MDEVGIVQGYREINKSRMLGWKWEMCEVERDIGLQRTCPADKKSFRFQTSEHESTKCTNSTLKLCSIAIVQYE